MTPPTLPGYEFLGLIGQGGTGRVYLATQVELEREVAIKELAAELVGVPGFIERFRMEAEIMARLDSPNCVRAIALIESAAGAYLVQELVRGASLDAVIGHEGKLGPEQSLGVVKGSLTGLAHAHALGLVHRDIKPANILVDLDGRSRLGDFGLAAPAGPATAGGVSLGTAAYMSPEQATGGPVGPATDIYATGVVLYELLSGRRPFAATDPAVLMRLHATETPPAPRGVGHGLAALVGRCMAKDPAARPASVEEVLDELESEARAEYGDDWALRASVAALAAAAFAGSGLAVLTGGATAAAVQTGATAVGSAAVAPPATAATSASASAAVTTPAATTAAVAAPASAPAAAAATAAPATTAASVASPAAASAAHIARAVSKRVARMSVRAKAAAAGVAVVAVTAGVVVATRPAANLLANAGFESGFGSQLRTIPVATSQGAWLAAGQTQVPKRVTAPLPVHSGGASVEVHTPNGGGSGYILQDVSSLTPTSSYELKVWVYPVVGKQLISVLYGWDRIGSNNGANYVYVQPGVTTFSAFGTTANAAGISYGAWHEVRMKVDAGNRVMTLFIDGQNVGTTAAGKSFTGLPTVTLGQGAGGSNPEDRFYYDDVTLTAG